MMSNLSENVATMTNKHVTTSVAQVREKGIQYPTPYDSQMFIANTELRGRGVFTLVPIPKGSLVHMAPVVELSPKDYAIAEQTYLYEYVYGWEKPDSGAVALGMGSLFNHDGNEANMQYECIYDLSLVAFVAKRDIEAKEELTINYQQRFNDIPLWFEKK